LLSTAEVPLEMVLTLTHMLVDNFHNIKVLSGYHQSAGLMSGNILIIGELRITMRILWVYNQMIKDEDNKIFSISYANRNQFKALRQIR
jgi:hypothetical protein